MGVRQYACTVAEERKAVFATTADEAGRRRSYYECDLQWGKVRLLSGSDTQEEMSVRRMLGV